MKTFRKLLVFAGILGILVLVAAPVRADWDDSMMPWTKWVQHPDLQYGMDVNATFVEDASGTTVWPFMKILADDFPCKTPGPITDIHIWGSWLFDEVNYNTRFKLSIHDDVPVDDPDNLFPYSHPGEELWSETFGPSEYAAIPWAPALEDFYDPNDDLIIGWDTLVWQYNFFPKEPFMQQGTATDPKVYWLDVQAMVPLASDVVNQEVFGWKTTSLDEHWNDDAVFADTDSFGGPLTSAWRELYYPSGPYAGQSMDMAFAITTPEPSTMVLLATGLVGLLAYAWRRRRR